MAAPDENQSICVLVVDDDLDTLDMYAIGLRHEGFTVYTASSGDATLTFLRANLPDCIVADVRMPGLSGIELCRKLAADPRVAAVPRLALTGSGYAHDLQLARAAGFERVLIKPCMPDELGREILSAVTISRAAVRTVAR
jgi:two-component system, chemotaxis family, CheB/CheR fusion protein